MQRETSIDTLEVYNQKSLKWKTIIALLLFIIAAIRLTILIISKDYWTNFKPASIFWLILLPLLVTGIFYYSKSLYYNKQVQLKIDQNGIWTPTCKTWFWKDIWYFSTSNESNGKYRINFLQIKLKDDVNDKKNSLLLPIDNYDKSKEEIRSIIEKYAALNNVQDLGDEIKN